ncbi:leptin receptor [Osmerus mordax]|uniref:leptin receptor n=1 Tax=Osmerus mordax TaxID=8014 RepID=UPI00350F5606
MICLDIQCVIDASGEKVICRLKPHKGSSNSTSGLTVITLRRLARGEEREGEVEDASDAVDCAGERPFRCSIAVGAVVEATVNVSGAVAPPVLLRPHPVTGKPDPPVNVSHSVTFPSWGLTTRSQPHPEYASYFPERVEARRGAEVSVRCLFNDPTANSSTSVWRLNWRLLQVQPAVVSTQGSQITFRPPEDRLYSTLQCYHNSTETFKIPYATIYVQGALINIRCETNRIMDHMTCQWNNSHMEEPALFSRSEAVTCDIMEEEGEEEAWSMDGGSEVNGTRCQTVEKEKERRSCTLQPLRLTFCYKLWLQIQSDDGPVRSHPVYVTPNENVKPSPPSRVKADVLPSRVLKLFWWPLYDLQYQVRYRPVAGRVLLEWQEVGPVSEASVEVPVFDACGVYQVEVRCRPTKGTGYWSDWTQTVYSTTLNRSAPLKGPDFWRILEEDPSLNKTYVTLLFKHVSAVEPSNCEDLVVQHQASGGAVVEEPIALVPSHRFEWRQEVHTVTVVARNPLGSSRQNINMTLDRHVKRPCLRWFRASLVNSSCVGLSWGLLANTSAPWSLVVEWSAARTGPQHGHGLASQTRLKWARVPFSERVFHLHGEFYGSEEYEFILYPIFVDREGEPMHTKATRGPPADYLLLIMITFLAIVLFVTLFMSQNHMKKLLWREVPNPNHCSWAQGQDFRKAETIDHLFRHPEGLPAWPLLLVSETISEVVIMEKTVSPTPALSPAPGPVPGQDLPRGHPGPAPFSSPSEGSGSGLSRTSESSAQSSVTYATVLLSDKPRLHHAQDGGSSSSDDGNFSANNSDISGSFPGGLWDLDTLRPGGSDPRRSCSFNSVEEFSEASEQEDEVLGGEGKGLYYLGMGCLQREEGEEEEEEEEGRVEERKTMLLQEVAVEREAARVESNSLLGQGAPRFESSEGGSGDKAGGVALYLPQFRTAPSRLHTEETPDSAPQL